MGKETKRNKTKDLRLNKVSIKLWTLLCEFDGIASLLYLDEPASQSPRRLPPEAEGTNVFINVQGKVTETYRKADQKYFRQHPDKKSYIRSPFPDEDFPGLRPRKVRVIQVEKGMRLREPIW